MDFLTGFVGYGTGLLVLVVFLMKENIKLHSDIIFAVVPESH